MQQSFYLFALANNIRYYPVSYAPIHSDTHALAHALITHLPTPPPTNPHTPTHVPALASTPLLSEAEMDYVFANYRVWFRVQGLGFRV